MTHIITTALGAAVTVAAGYAFLFVIMGGGL